VVTFTPLVAWASADLGDLEQAEAIITDMLTRAALQEQHLVLVDMLRIKAILATRGKHWEEAEAALEEALSLARAMPYPYAEAKALAIYGRLHAALSEPAWAREKYKAALTICTRLGERLYAEHIEHALKMLPV